MSAIARLAAVIMALGAFLGLTTTAGAVTWDNSGSTSFTATAGPMTLSSTNVNLTCTSSRATGTAASTVAGLIYSITGTSTASGCNIAGMAFYAHCSFTLTGLSQPSAGVTTGITDQTCQLKLTATNTAFCAVDGATSGTYTNPSGATPGRITSLTTSSIRITNVGGTTCPLGNNDPAVLIHRTGTISGGSPSPLGPFITRTP